MSYFRFCLMIVTSTVVMFFLMYLNTYALEHVFFSETRVYMAIMMGSAMAIIMLSYMLKMYPDKRLNAAILGGALVVFALSLWLVRSQVTVSGPSYMRAMIPHHSIAIMTSERAQIRDPRVRRLAEEIVDAQRREIAEMRHLIADISDAGPVQSIYRDPPAVAGNVEDALSNTLISQLDLAPMPQAEADLVFAEPPPCAFRRSPGTDPVLWMNEDGAVMKLNGVVVALESDRDPDEDVLTFTAAGTVVTVRVLGDGANWRQDAELVFALDQGLRVGYRGIYGCGG